MAEMRKFEDEAGEEALAAPAAEIEQVARTTSRKLLTLLVAGGGLLLVLHLTPWGQEIRDWNTLSGIFRTDDPRRELYFVLASSLLIMAGVPRLVFCALGGFAFGFWEGLLWSTLGSLLGSFAAFRAARWGGREWLSARFGGRRFFQRIVHARPTIASVALARLLPVANGIINVGLALSRVSDRVFVLGSLAGFLPQGVVATIVGSGLAHDLPWVGAAQIALAGVLLLAVFVRAPKRRRRH